MSECDGGIDLYCRDRTTALHLKLAAIAAILVSGGLGIALPLVGKRLNFLRTDGNFFFIFKAFAAGVILATGFVHMLPDAGEALNNPCLPEYPWQKFPWQGFFAMMAALCTLVVDFVGTEYYERKHGGSALHPRHEKEGGVAQDGCRIANIAEGGDTKIAIPEKQDLECRSDLSNSSMASGAQMHIVGMRAHAASHSHSHADGQHGAPPVESQAHLAGHQHVPKDLSDEESSLRHVVISQVLELGIVSHSVLIGLALGVSESPCTIRPLMSALVFHQFFEGFALGGCVSQAGFKYSSAIVMALFFVITTPFGICLGIGISSSYNENSPRALIIEGIFDAISAGILIYMALVDLIAADFLSKRMRCDRKLQLWSYIALFAGAGMMATLAIWA